VLKDYININPFGKEIDELVNKYTANEVKDICYVPFLEEL